MTTIHNPVPRGFHPDPSFVRVGEDFYLASSSFEWLPGVRIHHSRDLVHWRLAGHALTRPAQIDLRGVEDSNGVWAPSLSHAVMAEGGTGWNHGISLARSRALTGPHALDPQPAVLTTRHAPEHPLQKAGHGELVETADGEWWLAHLCSRPLKTGAAPDPKSADQTAAASSRAGQRCVLGRETALQRVVWNEVP